MDEPSIAEPVIQTAVGMFGPVLHALVAASKISNVDIGRVPVSPPATYRHLS